MIYLSLATAFFALLLLVGLGLLAIRERRARTIFDEENEALSKELRRLQSLQGQLIHSGKMASLGKMVAGITHEMNTPLGFVKSNVEIVRDLMLEYDAQVQRYAKAVSELLSSGTNGNGADPSREELMELHQMFVGDDSLGEMPGLLADAWDGLDQISNLVLNLKDFSRLDRAEGMVDNFDLRGALDNALTMADHLLGERIEVIKRYEDVPAVRCVPSQVNQVLLNLITNATQAIEGKGKILLATDAKDGWVAVSVADSGSGIPKDKLGKIFDPFYTTKTVGHGVGLGLSIVDRIVKGHGGKISVRTSSGKGTKFIVQFPVPRAVKRPQIAQEQVAMAAG
jgi:two-component system NtrC family sensor kinase